MLDTSYDPTFNGGETVYGDATWGGDVVLMRFDPSLSVGMSGVDDEGPVLRTGSFEIRPNPFKPATVFRFRVSEDSPVALEIHDVGGRSVRALLDARVAAGEHEVAWDGRDESGRAVASGVYFVTLTESARRTVRKVVLAK